MATTVQTVGDSIGYSETDLDITISSTVAGNTLLVGVAAIFGNTISGVAAGASSFTQDYLSAGSDVGIYRLSNISAGITTVSISKGNGGVIAFVQEVSGLDNSGQPDETNAFASTSEGFATSHTEALTPSEADTYGFAIVEADNGGYTFTGAGSATAFQHSALTQFGIVYEDGLSITSDTIGWSSSSSASFEVASAVYGAEPAGATITGSGTPSSGDSATTGTSERELPSSGTPAAQDAAAAGTSERELTGSGTPTGQAASTAATAERTLVCSGVLLAGASTVAGTASLALKLTLTAAAGQELRDEDGVLVANLANIAYEWYDKDTDTEGNPDQAGTFSTNASGEATIQLATTSLTVGQFGTLILTHPTDNTVRGVYRIPVA